MSRTTYRGRFAPSPTGKLHFGSLVAAVGSFLDARHHQGEWLVRIEDLDRTREVPGSAAEILSSLEALALHWDGEVIYQSRRTERYAEVVEQLLAADLAYPCSCSRKEIRERAQIGPEGPIYPGTCRSGKKPGIATNSIRLVTQDRDILVEDRLQGMFRQNPGTEIGDFVIRRMDGYHAYQLAVVVDDAWQKITDVVRGADLLSSTPRQCYLQQLLGLEQPNYLHLPLAVDQSGRKLSKQDRDRPVEPKDPLNSLLSVLAFLQQPLPPEQPESPEALWQWAIPRWRTESLRSASSSGL
ncbi:tRNA glutamyl-Q synthetase [Candidatus Thiodiazotropha endoloripes]|uniref:tRNA glutamyl-Q(34) synthetase GluQRS n=1 Tax=Candidatus Thiodiazotropha endoloripes TaxID=1818881 RepID=UPI00083E3423|nr:tRNA glutamyl-Q(34) synthetase GluQRS [Candidatus Thiodiazotropha endoloripes]ODB83088.1 tRNA glutamyl-Q synthetase [Candidatus Thiodiazotropha endoloripes]